MSKLFSKSKIKNLELKNRIVMPPMCMYSAEEDGKATDWHVLHYSTRAIGGVGLIIQEATGVEPRGRISSNDLGIWDDSQIDGLKKIVSSVKSYGANICIQLNHAGRKCDANVETIIAPSSIAYSAQYKTPVQMEKEDIENVVQLFKNAAQRALKAGYDIIEIHGAHGYLISQFLSPLTNKRTDEYGGSIENRAKFLLEVIKAVREVWPGEKPLMLRVSAEDYVGDGNHPEDVAAIINLVKHEGVDIINVSSGGVVDIAPSVYQGYQTKFAEIVREITNLPVVTGGLLSDPHMAEEILRNERADFVFIGRELLRNPYWPLYADTVLNNETDWPIQYERARRIKKAVK